VTKTEKIYVKFIQFEERAAAVYLQLASRFSPQEPELSAFWLDMAMQEKQHAGLLQFCLAEQLFSPNLPDAAKIRAFDRLFRSLERKAADPGIGVDGAFEVALELERSEVDSIYRHLTVPLHQSIYLLKRKITASPACHIQYLAATARKFGVKSTVLSELDSLTDSMPAA